MKYSLLIFIFCVLSSCKALISTPPVTQKTPDVISKPTNTIITKDVIAEIPKNTNIKTDSVLKTKAVLTDDITVIVESDNTSQVLIPKNTQIILPENTKLQTIDSTKVEIDAKTEVVLPIGTEISITKINWYAILFYALAIISLFYLYLRSSREDADGDGFVDIKKSKKKTTT